MRDAARSSYYLGQVHSSSLFLHCQLSAPNFWNCCAWNANLQIYFFFLKKMSDPAIPHPKEDFDGFQSSLFKALMSASVASNALDGSQIGFHRSLDRQFAKNMDHSASHLLTAANRLLQQCAHDTGVDTMEFEDADDVNNRYINVVEVVDALLEKAVCFWVERLLEKKKKYIALTLFFLYL